MGTGDMRWCHESTGFSTISSFSRAFFTFLLYVLGKKTIKSLSKFSNFTIFFAEHFTNPVISVDLKFNPICLRSLITLYCSLITSLYPQLLSECFDNFFFLPFGKERKLTSTRFNIQRWSKRLRTSFTSSLN